MKIIFKHRWNPYLIFFFGIFVFLGYDTAYGFQDDSNRDTARGGRLYGAWDLEINLDLGVENHPLWESQDFNIKDGVITWRCSTCHGADYKGVDGVSAEGTEWYTGFPGIIRASNYSLEDIVLWLNGRMNPNHDFSKYLNEQDLNDLSTFIKSELFDMSLIIDYEYQDVVGEGSRGEVLYKASCRECHGTDGVKINFGSIERPVFLGNVVNHNPWRVIHLVKFGHIGVEAPNSYTLNWSIIDLADILDYLLLLPRTLEEDLEIEEVIDYSYQGNTNIMIQVSIAIAGIIYIGIGWEKFSRKKSEKY